MKVISAYVNILFYKYCGPIFGVTTATWGMESIYISIYRDCIRDSLFKEYENPGQNHTAQTL